MTVSSNSVSNSAQNTLSEVVDGIIKYNYTTVHIISEKCAILVLMVAFKRVFEKVQLRTHLLQVSSRILEFVWGRILSI